MRVWLEEKRGADEPSHKPGEYAGAWVNGSLGEVKDARAGSGPARYLRARDSTVDE